MDDDEIEHHQLFHWWYEWRYRGRAKNDIERHELMDTKSNGKRMSRLWRERLGKETERVHPLVRENRRLRSVLISCGVDPDTLEDI
jgi:hypothetical protein